MNAQRGILRLNAMLIGAAVLDGGPAAAAPTNDDCLACHKDAAATRGDASSIAVDPKAPGRDLPAPIYVPSTEDTGHRVTVSTLLTQARQVR